MFRNHLKIAFRHLLRDRQSSLLNIIGLSTGLACALLVWLWVSSELKMDAFHKKQLYQVMQNVPLADKNVMSIEHTPDLLAEALKEEIPAVEEAVIIKAPDEDESATGILYSNDQTGIKAKELFVTPDFFDAFSCNLLQGNPQQAFPDINTVILSEQVALKLFHSTENVIGKTIKWSRGNNRAINGSYIIAGISQTPAENATLKFDVLFPHELYVKTATDDINWNSSNPFTFVVLKPGSNVQHTNQQIKNFLQAKTGDKQWTGTLFLQQYKDKYLHNHYENGSVTGGRIEYVKLFSIMAVFILLIACINFTNLSTAKASVRLKEVGIKKVIGADRGSLILQYLTESVLTAFISLLAAIILVMLLLPAFNQLTGKQISLYPDATLIASFLAVTLITGLIAGSYPALYLSGFKPAVILKGRLHASQGESWIRKGLVVFQFSISVILIISVLIAYRQMQLIQNKNLGYSKDNVLRFANEGALQENLPAMLSQLKALPGVVNASAMEGDMFGNHSGGGGISWPGKTERIEFSGLYVDHSFGETLGLQMKEGHMFSANFGDDTTGVIFNETAIAAMKLKDPVGKIVQLWGTEKHIIGVVKDFHFESLYKKVGPFFLSYRKNTANVLVRIKTCTEKQTLAQITSIYKKYNPGLPFEYRFLNEDFQTLYASEQRVAILSRYFALMAILISSLGLFGLAAFTAQRRQKEIGIRKVVGASVSSLMALLSADYLKLVWIAFVLAVPLSYWMLNQWLQSFAYRVYIGAGVFLITGAAITIITLITICFQTIKAAVANPVKSLRSE